MKKYIFLLLLFPSWVFAQERQIIEMGSGDDLNEKVSTHLQYLFPEFTNGEVFFRNAPKSGGALNYNMLVGEMQFMHSDGVIALADVRNVTMRSINNHKFYPYNNREFSEELLSTDKAQLLVRRKGTAVNYAQRGALGTSSSTSAISSYSSISSGDRQYELSVMGDILISLKYYYYIVGSNGKYTQIKNVRTFTKPFPTHRIQIESFAKEHNVRFDKEADLKALLVYCSEL